ncbi:MAG: glycosyltransferase [Verrucomicrobia bacterium]|jgi:glycosyltransferase involved in cell wall biosynthesis|nr:glycosyltransferase [Verrucomicrobiota bacterium]
MKISATIITFNEEQKIKKCLDSLCHVADEIVVVDSFSSDQTESICKSYDTVRFLKNRFEGHIQQKNFALDEAEYDDILSLDADECLSELLINEIQDLKSGGGRTGMAYSMPRLNNYCGQWIQHSGWYPDRKVRLWDRKIGRWGGRNPHDSVVLDRGVKIESLRGDILHDTISSLAAHVNQTNKFSEIAARQLFDAKPRTAATFKMISDPPFTFLKRYVLQRGFLDGFHGLTIAVISAHAKFLKYAKFKELKSRHEDSSSKL